MVDLQSKRIIDANGAMQCMLGFTLEELKGMTVYDLVAHDQESIDQNVKRVLDGDGTFVGERKYRCKNGLTVDVEVKATAMQGFVPNPATDLTAEQLSTCTYYPDSLYP